MRAPDFWHQHDAAARALALALWPLGYAHGRTIAWKAANAPRHRARARVICVGNLTAGGSGKTPIAIAIFHALAARGIACVFLSRGYGGRLKGPLRVDTQPYMAGDVGDEPLLLARTGPVIVAADRKAGAELADTQGFAAIIMDDGHQNFALEKDLSIIVADAAAGFGNGHVLPAGPLREPIAQGLARADAVVLAGDGSVALAGFTGPILRTHLLAEPPAGLRGAKFVAFAGIGRPEKFYASLRAAGAVLAATRDFADHHVYTAAQIARLRVLAKKHDAMLITTEKDLVRLSPHDRQAIAALPVRAQFDEPAALGSLIAPLFASAAVNP